MKGVKYKINADGKSVTVTGVKNKKSKSILIPAKVKYAGVSYRISKIGKNAFKNCKKVKLIEFKTVDLKNAGKNCFKGINNKAVIKGPAKKLKANKKLFKSKGQSKNVIIKK